ncbi:hypothetical protein [Ramlibacter albus]|uniref:Uncharacterized protein n=1 Tax=Ramlibacter albus TaxID=2079448 RepID=A0A923M874_9BURK|nr:hypothetical protein [Ramlibacter albus]MBC5764636.1 hypothetical protein [Ramlibacter albus]
MRMIGKFGPLALVVASLLPPAEANAVTLGRARGAAIIGRPVNVTVPLTLEPGEAEPCVQAEVFQGDSRMGGITLRTETTASGPVIRILSSGALEEPTLVFYLRVGCGQQVTRRYVMLAELHDEQGATAVVTPPRLVAPAPSPAAAAAAATSRGTPDSMAVVPQAGTAAPSSGQSAAAPAPSNAARARSRAAAPSPDATAAQSPNAAAARPGGLRSESRLHARAAATSPPDSVVRKNRRAQREEAGAGRSRLKLEPLDLSIDYSPSLRSSPLLLSTEQGGTRRTEAAALWRALNAPPEELIRQSQRIEAMEREMQALRTAVQQNNAALNAVGKQLDKARSERDWMTTLFAALAVMSVLAAAAWLWSRRRPARSGSRWWVRDSSGRESEFPPDLASHHPPPPPPRPTQPRPLRRDEPVDLDVSDHAPLEPTPPLRTQKLDAQDMREARDRRDAPDSRPQSRSHMDFMPSQAASLRMVKAEELIDIQQQAEFFLSIGHADQAASVLEAHVHDHVETSPVVWLDLLEMYHSLDRQADYERIRAEFAAQFNAHVPDFDNYRMQSNGLEDYRRALSRIVALWPSPRVLEVIEESIFRKPGTPGAETFDLEAYRDLLLLYNIGKQIAQEEPEPSRSSLLEDDARVSGFMSTDIQPLSALVHDSTRGEGHSLSPFDRPPAGSTIAPLADGADVDIDLGALAPMDNDMELPAMDFDFDSIPPKRR